MDDNNTVDELDKVSTSHFRLNDEIVSEDNLSRDIVENFYMYSDDNNIKLSEDERFLGKYQIIRYSCRDIYVDPTSDQSYYPFDTTNIALNFDFYSPKLQFVLNSDGKYEKYDINNENHANMKPIFLKFNYHLYYTNDFTEMIKFKAKTINNLETHYCFMN